jgi:S1-C subfamily serine protease
VRHPNLLITLIIGVVVVLGFALVAHPVDVDGRAQALRVLQASAVLKTSANSDRGFCGATVANVGIVLTAYHCVREFVDSSTRPIYVEVWGDKAYPAKILSTWVGVDLALLQFGGSGGRIPQLAPDIAVGETLYLTGAPDGEPFVVTKGVVSKIYRDKFSNCPKTVLVGTDVHQIFAFDGLTWLGNSGGGLFNQDGQLAGVLVRLHVTGEDGGDDCKASTLLGQALWGYAVGVDTIREKMAR